ncbi:OmpA family protein [Arundinibacter roseus]|uniref:Flagellar motor protein MotB n=1 Tax=Arundinibacter roseus TaxID=2070510 RepID=A0A4R4KIX0_9BACT|nr:OmpA family protein [Arundinibacter roseus]TDB68210.1 flagellar motor protein MotB [Arundinibacter roseus]
MSTYKIPWWIALFAWIGLSTYWHVCKIKELCEAPLISKEVQRPSLHIEDGNALSLHSAGTIDFAKAYFEANVKQVQPELDSLVRYLRVHPQKRLSIVGAYAALESNPTSYPDLGIARAEYIKQLFVKQGLPDSIFTTSSRLIGNAEIREDSLLSGVSFGFTEVVPQTEDALARAEVFESVFKPLDLYFPSGSSDFIRTDENAEFIKEAKRFLSENPDKKLMLTGHTDSDGDEARNVVLSEKRANQVKKDLVKAGLSVSQLMVVAKGETEPKASNDTPEGKRANRRVSIVVQ